MKSTNAAIVLCRTTFEIGEMFKNNLNWIPESVWMDENVTFIDPFMAGGQACGAVEEKLKKLGFSDAVIKTRVFGRSPCLIDLNYAVQHHGLVGDYRVDNREISDMFESMSLNFKENHKKNGVTIGNPPYNGEKGQSCNTDTIYPQFIDWSVNNSKYVLMVTPARWYMSSTTSEHRKNMIFNYGLKYLRHLDNGEYFGDVVDVKGGYSVFLLETGYKGDVTFVRGDSEQLRDFKTTGRIYLDSRVESIIKKISEKSIASTENLYFRNGEINSSDERIKETPFDNSIVCHQSKNRTGYVIEDDYNGIDKFKVITAVANSGAYEFNPLFRIVPPGEVATASFCCFYFDTKDEATKFINFVSLKMNVFSICNRKSTQGVTSECFSYVPQLWSKIQTDADLYAHFNLTDDEIKLVETSIKS